ncbi:MAG: mismatch repair protein MutL [Euryarchaeota archaeon]|nr:mismatch repair protein MutL [Euryarchaeota archaeon]
MIEEHTETQENKGEKIRILDKDTINKIAAGEVIERPTSVVKELIDNSIDAGATDIRIEVENGGKKSILVRDNGCGMSRADALIAYKKHATSKLIHIEDLNTISTMGFRGEALASISAVAKIEILTRPPDEITGTKIIIHGGKVIEITDAGSAPGTSVYVKDLFYNTPARRKYLKSDRTELAHITDTVTQLALANPAISFTLLSEGKSVLRNTGSKDIFNSIVNLLGPDTARSMLPLESGKEEFEIQGYISKPEITRSDGDQLFIFVNTRPVTSRAITAAVRNGYYTKIPKGRYPVAVLSLTVDPGEVDVNVHPRKSEVRFSREKELEDTITGAVEKSLSEHALVHEVREKGNRNFKRNFEISGFSEGLKVSETQDTLQKPMTNAEMPEKFGMSGGSREIPGERSGIYTYPVKDTERKLRKSERLLGLYEEARAQEKEPEKVRERVHEASVKEQKPNTSLLEELRVIGQVSKMYIIAEKGEDLVLIDQHAAHERILYEQVIRMKKPRVQELITPITIELSPKEKVLMEDYIPYLEEYGFGISEFGDNTFVVTFVPDVFGQLEHPEFIHDIINDLLASGKVKKETGISEKVSKTLACRAAIKGGAACSLRQMEELIEQLKKAENPYSCPHGRPTIITFTKAELDRMFARTQ